MPTLKWALAAKNGGKDEQGQYHIISEFDQAKFPKYPTPALPIHIFTRWGGTTNEIFDFRVSIQAPTGVAINWIDNMAVNLENGSVFIHTELSNTVFPANGEYVVEIYANDNLVHAFTLIFH